jgi:D-alanyl-D-alanine carboxypeptidase
VAVSNESNVQVTQFANTNGSSAGGQYSSTRDLRTWGAAMLRSAQMAPVATRRWMKPTSVTGQWAVDVGVSS